ncbi:hypothetical protein CEXT_15541 [Caerostris extrusa]|uniref:Transmembrane protein n=1 Tax=Caerostris extrusa TaxID=172846 RepID=A0AAV4MC47_CAEEX|nr:hypothetical protein CEXT_15541 [Caerostris extrusa]
MQNPTSLPGRKTNDSPRAVARLPSRPQGLKITLHLLPTFVSGFQKGIERKSLFSAALVSLHGLLAFQSFRFKEKEQRGWGWKNIFKEVPLPLTPLTFSRQTVKRASRVLKLTPTTFLHSFSSFSVVSKREFGREKIFIQECETISLIYLRNKDNASHSRFPAPKRFYANTPHLTAKAKQTTAQGGRKTPQSTAGAENHSHLLSHSFVCNQEGFRKELKEKSPFSAALGFITRPVCFQSFHFRKGTERGKNPFLRRPLLS